MCVCVCVCVYLHISHILSCCTKVLFCSQKKRHKYRNSAQSRSEVCTGRRELIFYKGSVLTAAAVTLVDGFRDAVLQRGFYHVGHLTVTIRKLKHLTLSAYRTLCEKSQHHRSTDAVLQQCVVGLLTHVLLCYLDRRETLNLLFVCRRGTRIFKLI